MPFYTYICENCASVCEQFHGMTESSKPCPECGSNKLGRIPTTVSVTHDNGIGQIVKEFIKDNKEINQMEKDRLSKQEYKK